MSREKVTIYDVAEELGISIATVNRALNGKPNVEPGVRERDLLWMRQGKWAISPARRPHPSPEIQRESLY